LLIIIMEYISGGDLGRLINEQGSLSQPKVQQMSSQLLSALGYLHENNITHRDVKPDNILISSINPVDVKLTDFGLSKMVDNEQTFLRTFCGTLLYCAPEVYSEYAEYDDQGRRHPRNRAKRAAVGQRYDHAVDVWSLGGVIFYSLTGSPPYPVKSGVSHSELLHQIMTTNLNVKPLQNAGVTREGIEFLQLMLQRRPESRATVKSLESHVWLGGPGSILLTVPADAQSFDDVSEDDDLDASQLSLEERQRKNLVEQRRIPANDTLDDIIDNASDNGSEKENYTFGERQYRPQLFGEINGSEIGSSGVITEHLLNLPVSGTNLEDSGVLGPEVKDSYDSQDASTLKHKSEHNGGARLSYSLGHGQSADQLHSLVQDVESQSLGATESMVDDMHMQSVINSRLLSHNSDLNTSKRKPSYDSSGELSDPPTADKPIFKRLKSEGNIDSLAEEMIAEYKLLASSSAIARLTSKRQIDNPFDKMGFWNGRDPKTWHLNYPEMTQVQHDTFVQAAKERNEEFAAGKSPLWELAMKYFPPGNGQARGIDGGDKAVSALRTAIRGDDRNNADWDIPGTAEPSDDPDSLPSTLPPDTQIIVPIQADLSNGRAIAILESDSGSVVPGISVPITDSLISWGRGPENTAIFEPKTESKVPKYAFKVILWKDGYDSSKEPAYQPWEKVSATAAQSYHFYISTKATNGVAVNNFRLHSYDSKNASSPSQNWVRLHNGDEIIVWGTEDINNQTRVRFHCLWGGSSSPRSPRAGEQGEPIELVPSPMAKKLDDACLKTERRIKAAAERRRCTTAAFEELKDRHQYVEMERERSRVFEMKVLEAIRYLASGTTSRRVSPASAPPPGPGSSNVLGITGNHSIFARGTISGVARGRSPEKQV
jgi:serine/threonine protein kinase